MNGSSKAASLIAGLLALTTMMVVGVGTGAEPVGPSTMAQVTPIGAMSETPATDGAMDLAPTAIAVRTELQRAIRILQELEDDQSHAFVSYIVQVERMVEWFGRVEPGVGSLRRLNAALMAAHATLEKSLSDVHAWRRFARASDPQARVLRVPRRFVKTVQVDADPLDRLSDDERTVWLAEA